MSKERNYADPFDSAEDNLNTGATRIFNLKADKGREIPQQLRLDLITVDQSIQVRVDGLEDARVETLRVVYESGGEMKDPIIVYNVEGRYLLVDGFHRHEAARLAGRETVLAVVREGTIEEAITEAEDANLKHGKPLDDHDKRELYTRRHLRGHEWASMSQRAVAAILGVDHKTIGNWRARISDESTGEISPVEKTIGRDGKARDTSGISAANQQRTPATPIGRTRMQGQSDPAVLEKGRRIIQLREAGILEPSICGPYIQGHIDWAEVLRRAGRTEESAPMVDAENDTYPSHTIEHLPDDEPLDDIEQLRNQRWEIAVANATKCYTTIIGTLEEGNGWMEYAMTLNGVDRMYALERGMLEFAKSTMVKAQQLATKLSTHFNPMIQAVDVMIDTGLPSDPETAAKESRWLNGD